MSLLSDASNVNSNSLCTLSFADTYFQNRPHSSKWSGSSESVKEAALVWSSLLLTRSYIWKGVRVEKEQLLAFPRYGLETIDGYYVDSDIFPRQIQEGVCELSLLLLGGELSGTNPLDSGITDIKVSSIELKFSKSSILDGSNVDGNQIPERIRSLFFEFIEGSTNKLRGSVRLKRT